MKHYYIIHAEHLGIGDNKIQVGYVLETPISIETKSLVQKKAIGLVAIHNQLPSKAQITCNEQATTIDNTNNLDESADYGIFNRMGCEFIDVIKLQPASSDELKVLSHFLQLKMVKLTPDQIENLI